MVPPTWSSAGSVGMMSKKGTPFTLVNFINEGGVKISFFSDRMAKDENGNLLVEITHFNAQVERGVAWAKKQVGA